LVSVITSISFDHTAVLGNSISSIAREKGGIIKRGVPCVTSSRDPVALRVFDSIATRRQTSVRRAARILRLPNPVHPPRVRFSSGRWKTRPIKLGLAGEHQVRNAQLAGSAFLLAATSLPRVPREVGIRALENGLERVRKNTALRARFEQLRYNGVDMILDVAHNPGAASVLVDTLKESGIHNPVVVLGVLRDKDARGFVSVLRALSPHIVCVTPGSTRALRGRELALITRALSIPTSVARSVRQGLDAATRRAGARTPVVVTGSHYLVGEALAILARDPTPGKSS
jgi:dihydrofolate synthase/folylpolyglutamate synthase